MTITILNIDTLKREGIRKTLREDTLETTLKTGNGDMDMDTSRTARAGIRGTEDLPVIRRRTRRENTSVTPAAIRNLRENILTTATQGKEHRESMPAIPEADTLKLQLLSLRGDMCPAAVLGIRRKNAQGSMPARTPAAGTRNPEENMEENTAAANTWIQGTLPEDTPHLKDTRGTQGELTCLLNLRAADIRRDVNRENTTVTLEAVMFRSLRENTAAAVTRSPGEDTDTQGDIPKGDIIRGMNIFRSGTRTSCRNIWEEGTQAAVPDLMPLIDIRSLSEGLL
jgi:hypothetical protein